MIYFCNEVFCFCTVCFSLSLACLLNNFVFKHSLTLYEEISRSWSWGNVKLIAIIYFVFTCSLIVPCLIYCCLSKFESVRLHFTNHSRIDFLLNYICTELTLKLGDKMKCRCGLAKRVVLHVLWCALFAPSMLMFKSDIVILSLKEMIFLLIALTLVVFFWNIQHQRYLMGKLVPVVFVLHIFLTATSVLLIVLGYPHNIFGFTLIYFILHFGFLFYALLFILSTQVSMEFNKTGTQDILENITDLFVCTVHLFARISVLNSFDLVLSVY